MNFIAEATRDVLTGLPALDTYAELGTIVGEIVDVFARQRGESLGRLRAAVAILPRPVPAAGPIGLNTPGLLCDRLTILLMKQHHLRLRAANQTDQLAQVEADIDEISASLAASSARTQSLTGKVTKIRASARPTDWADAYYGLLLANAVMWEAQKILYDGEIEKLDAEIIRTYVAVFSEWNVARNELIVFCDAHWP